jgi:hypothetical protein
MLPRGPAAEIPARHDDIALPHFFREGSVGMLHAVPRELRPVRRIQILRRYYFVGIYVVAKPMRAAFIRHLFYTYKRLVRQFR